MAKTYPGLQLMGGIFFVAGGATLTTYLYSLNYIRPDYIQYLYAAIIIAGGYVVISALSTIAYNRISRAASKQAAATVRTVTKVVGYAILLSSLTSILSLNPSFALTVGSFAGIVAGLASQTVLGNAFAGILLIIIRPFRVDDEVTVAGNTGRVKSIEIMHTILETQVSEVLIPSLMVLNSVIIRKNIVAETPVQTKK